LSKSRKQEVANLTPENRRRYSTYRAWGLISGFVSLFSFWIMVLVNEVIPYGGASYGLARDGRLMEWAPAGLMLALAAFVTALWLVGKARAIRETYWHPSITNPVDEK
jgi:hypothetical protein